MMAAIFALGFLLGGIIGGGFAGLLIVWLAGRGMRFKILDVPPEPVVWIQPSSPSSAHPLDPDGLMNDYDPEATHLDAWNNWRGIA